MTWCGSFSFWGWPSVLNGDILTIDPQNPSKVHPSGSVRHRWPKSSRRIACWRSMYRPSSWGDFGFLRLWWLDHFNSNPWLNTIWTIASSSSDKSQVVTDKPKNMMMMMILSFSMLWNCYVLWVGLQSNFTCPEMAEENNWTCLILGKHQWLNVFPTTIRSPFSPWRGKRLAKKMIQFRSKNWGPKKYEDIPQNYQFDYGAISIP